MNIENRIEYLEQKISSLEATVEKLKEGNFSKLSTNKIIIKQKQNEDIDHDEDLHNPGIYIFDKNESLLYKTIITKHNAVRTIFLGKHDEEVVELVELIEVLDLSPPSRKRTSREMIDRHQRNPRVSVKKIFHLRQKRELRDRQRIEFLLLDPQRDLKSVSMHLRSM